MDIKPADLRSVSVFREATDEDLQLFLSQAILRKVEEDSYFFLQGDPAVYFYILAAGRAKLLQSNAAGQQVNLRTITEWQMFGALGVVKPGAVYPASAQALEASTALAIESAFMHRALKPVPT